MTKTIALLTILSLRLAYQPVQAPDHTAPFANPGTVSTPNTTARILQLTGNVENNKAILEWEVGGNESAYLFEVEKSTDGKPYSTAAIVFGSDQPEKARYSFYEKSAKGRSLYRVKLVDKNKTAVYSAVLELNPKA